VILYLDTETYSAVPITHGTYKYTENAEVMLCTFAVDEDPVQCFDFTSTTAENMDTSYYRGLLVDLIRQADIIVAHNAMFDRNVLGRGDLKIQTPIQKWRCTMARAMGHGLPGALGKLCPIMGVPSSSSKMDGNRLIHLFCKPQPTGRKVLRATVDTHPKDWAKFIAYAKMDVEATRELWKRLPSWNYGEKGAGKLELDLWHLDQETNDRGVYVDLNLISAAKGLIDTEQKKLRKKTSALTNGVLESTTQRDATLGYLLVQYGLGLPDLTAATVRRFLKIPEIDSGLRELLLLRQQTSKSSTAKYSAFERATSRDGRLRGMLQFFGAQRTRRDAGRTVQLQNLPARGVLDAEFIPIGVDTILGGYAGLMFDDIMKLTASTIRAVMQAPLGKKFVISDLSNIEGRGLAWLAGEDWKVKAYEEFDRGEGYDLYNLTYSTALSVPVETVTKKERSIGKVMELALGYAGGISAFASFAAIYRLDLNELAEKADIKVDVLAEAKEFVKWQKSLGRTYAMSDKAAEVCEAFKRMWRAAHPATTALWAGLQELFADCVSVPGATFTYGRFKARMDGPWLRIRLPSGRFLVYPHAEVAMEGNRPQLSFMGINGFTKKWERIKTFGGKLTENATQSVARDFMFDTLHSVEKAGYPVILRVHDELVCETPDTGKFTHEKLSRLLATNPPWGKGMPLAAAGFETYIYRKGD